MRYYARIHTDSSSNLIKYCSLNNINCRRSGFDLGWMNRISTLLYIITLEPEEALKLKLTIPLIDIAKIPTY